MSTTLTKKKKRERKVRSVTSHSPNKLEKKMSRRRLVALLYSDYVSLSAPPNCWSNTFAFFKHLDGKYIGMPNINGCQLSSVEPCEDFYYHTSCCESGGMTQECVTSAI